MAQKQKWANELVVTGQIPLDIKKAKHFYKNLEDAIQQIDQAKAEGKEYILQESHCGRNAHIVACEVRAFLAIGVIPTITGGN